MLLSVHGFKSSTYCSASGSSGLLANDVEHTVLESLLILGEPVLLPGVVKDASIEVVSLHAALEEADASAIVGLLLEFQRSAVLHELTELAGVSTAQLLKGSFDLLLLDGVVLFILGTAGESLPWKLALEQVEQNVTDGLKIVSSRLLNTLVGGDGGITSRASQVLAILVGDVLALAVLVALGKTEIDDVDVITSGVLTANEEVIRFDITVDYALLVHLLDTSDKLNGDHQNSFEIEIALARLEEVLKGWTKEIHDHDMELVVGH